jgi:valyl-tRNA synthetase
MKIGRRLAIKILNASKFVLMLEATENDSAITEPVDKALLARLAITVQNATTAFDDFNYAKALEVTESFFWNLTDDYVELVKERAYGAQGDAKAESAKATLATTLKTLLGLFAPFMPFVTEEVWSWWQVGSVHRSTWPTSDTLEALSKGQNPKLLDDLAVAISGIRKAKSDANVSMRAKLSQATITAPSEVLDRLQLAAEDIKAAGCITQLLLESGDQVSVTAVLAPD